MKGIPRREGRLSIKNFDHFVCELIRGPGVIEDRSPRLTCVTNAIEAAPELRVVLIYPRWRLRRKRN
jgi:hypothetical protein